MLSDSFACEVEFLGGPIDGHVEAMLLPLHAYVGVKLLLEEGPESLLHSLLKKLRAKNSTRVAIYQLGNSNNGTRICYRYIRSQILPDKAASPEEAIDTIVKRLCENKQDAA